MCQIQYLSNNDNNKIIIKNKKKTGCADSLVPGSALKQAHHNEVRSTEMLPGRCLCELACTNKGQSPYGKLEWTL